MKKLNQAGSHLLGVVVLVLVLAGVGLIGYRVSHRQNGNTVDTHAVDSADTPTTTVPATIKTSADLTAVSKLLDASSAQLNSSLDGSSYTPDLDSML